MCIPLSFSLFPFSPSRSRIYIVFGVILGFRFFVAATVIQTIRHAICIQYLCMHACRLHKEIERERDRRNYNFSLQNILMNVRRENIFNVVSQLLS